MLDVKQRTQALGTKQEFGDVELAAVQRSIQQYSRTQEIRRDSALSTEALQERHGFGNDGDDVGETELATQIEPQSSPSEPQPPPPSQYDDGEVDNIDKELWRIGVQIINLGRQRRKKRLNIDPIGELREFLNAENFMAGNNGQDGRRPCDHTNNDHTSACVFYGNANHNYRTEDVVAKCSRGRYLKSVRDIYHGRRAR